MLGSDTGSGTVGTTEDDGTGDVTTRHVVGLTARVDDLVDRLHGKVPGHCVRGLSWERMISRGGGKRGRTELANGSETGKGSTDGHTSETSLGNGSLKHS